MPRALRIRDGSSAIAICWFTLAWCWVGLGFGVWVGAKKWAAGQAALTLPPSLWGGLGRHIISCVVTVSRGWRILFASVAVALSNVGMTPTLTGDEISAFRQAASAFLAAQE